MNNTANPIRIRSRFSEDVTVLSNSFLDRFLPEANGDFLKVYLALLRSLSGGRDVVTAESLADRLNCTETDVVRALRYWEGAGVITLASDEDGTIRSLTFTDQNFSGSDESNEVAKPSDITSERMAFLSGQEDIQEILFMAQQYLGKRLTRSDVQRIFYFYDSLHFSTELITYLLEYCVGKNHRSMAYIEKVALSWHSQGITTPHEAKLSTMNYHREYYDILRALGIDNHNPVEKEIEFMNRWLDDYHFSMDIIREACSRTVVGTGKPTLSYADGILKSWHEAGVTSLADIAKLDEAHDQTAKERKRASRTGRRPKTGGSFDYSGQRKTDDDLEAQLLKKTREKYSAAPDSPEPHEAQQDQHTSI